MNNIIRNYGLSMILFVLFVLSWIGQSISQWIEFQKTEIAHGQEVTLGGFIPTFWSATFENWQSEFLQLFSFVVLATYFIHKNSPQSRDGDDRRDAQLNRIEKLLGNKDNK